ncbi:MAG: hypothetical protein ACI37R_00080 [Candidatus Avigastranaerophilus sp.]
MNKNFKVITINGFRGIIAAVFVVSGLIAGFIISPGWVCMKLWNYFFEYSSYFSQMNLYHGILLWLVIALSLYALNNRRSLIGFGSYSGLSPEQIRDIMEKTRKAEVKLLQELKEKAKNEESETVLKENQVTVEEPEEVRK